MGEAMIPTETGESEHDRDERPRRPQQGKRAVVNDRKWETKVEDDQNNDGDKDAESGTNEQGGESPSPHMQWKKHEAGNED